MAMTTMFRKHFIIDDTQGFNSDSPSTRHEWKFTEDNQTLINIRLDPRVQFFGWLVPGVKSRSKNEKEIALPLCL